MHFPSPLSKITGGSPKAWICQLAVAICQTAFVVGSVYLKASLNLVGKNERFSPLVFAFAREATAAPILYTLAWFSAGSLLPALSDCFRVVGLGFCIFASQLLYIFGMGLSGVVVATCMQPAIPVFTILLGVLFKLETASAQKIFGIVLAVSGAVCMVAGGGYSGVAATDSEETKAATRHQLHLGNVCFFFNTLAMAGYYILGKKLTAKYSAAQITAWAYVVGASLMGTAAAVFTEPADWKFPSVLWLPLVYWVLVCSVTGYYVVTWAITHLPASQVASFQCLQPFLGSLLAFLVLHEEPSWFDLGAIAIVVGLLCVVLDKKDVQAGGARMKAMVTGGRKKSKAVMALGLPAVVRE